MNAKLKTLVLTLVLLVLAAASAQARQKAPVWKIDPDHTSFTFTIRHILGDVPGRFDKFSGKLSFDPENLDDSAFDITVKTASVNTAVAKRDEHLRGADFFEVKRYPDMRFVSTEILHKEGDAYVAKGKLTIKNESREVEIPFTFRGVKDNPMQQGVKVAGFRFAFPVVLADYKVSDGRFTRMGLVGDTAQLVVNMEALR
ncbi:YceI family protein [Fundidesulfovibrio butyratiphilus]